MNNSPVITVLMPVYNCESYVREAIDSILNQSYTNFEFLIVNDGSTDRTEEIIRSYKDDRIVLVNQANGGVSNALNNGLHRAKGKYIARFDADDICYHDRLEEQLAFMEKNPEYVLIGSDADYISESGEFIFSYQNTGHSDEEIKERIYAKNPLIHSTVFFPKQLVIDIGGYDEGAHTFEDHLLWVKFIHFGKVCNFKKPSIKVRLNPASVTTDERIRGKRFLEIRQRILLSNDRVCKKDSDELLDIIRKQNIGNLKVVGYHMFVAKKYLWNNYKPAKAREHLWQIIKLQPFNYTTCILIILSFMPRMVVNKLYEFVK